MGKKVTFGIEYAVVSNLKEDLKGYISSYKSLLRERRPMEAAQTIIEATEFVLDESNELEDQLDPDMLHYLSTMAGYCKKVIKLLEDRQDTQLLLRAYNDVSQCYLKLHSYHLAVQNALTAISVHKQSEQSDNKSSLQSLYKGLGDMYFKKSLDQDECRYDDYQNAHRYYKLEREVIDTMTLEDIEDPEPDDLTKLIQSSHFNMGVMESKIPSWYEAAEKDLKKAVTLAHTVKDFAAEKTAWWELGNLYKRVKQYDNVKFCQGKEYYIIKKHGFTADVFYCFEERFEFLLFMDEHDQCFQLYEDALQGLDRSDAKKCKNLYDIAVRVKSSQIALKYLNTREDFNPAFALSFLEHIQHLKDHELNRLVVKSVDSGLASISEARDYTHLIHAQLLLHKAEALWNLKESKKEVYINAANETLEFIDAVLTDRNLDKLKFKMDIYRLFIRIYTYFDEQSEINAYEQLLAQTNTEEKTVRARLTTGLSPLEIETFGQTRITPRVSEFISRRICVTINIKPVPVQIAIQYENMPRFVQGLMHDIERHCFNEHGVQVLLSHIQAHDKDAFPDDLLRDIVTTNNQMVKAIVKRIVQKSPLEIYQNAASRSDVTASAHIEWQLSNRSMKEISLSHSIVSKEIDLIRQVFQRSVFLSVLDLSSNFLKNEDVSTLFQDTCKGLIKLNLSNNLLTTDCLSTMAKFSHLDQLDLSYNPLGPAILQQLPTLLQNIPSLHELNLSATHLGDYIYMEPEIKAAYELYGLTTVFSSLTLHFSENHFEQDMLWHWTNMWKDLGRISCLYLSNISCDTTWDNFDALSDLPKLSDLIFRYSVDLFSMCDFQQLLVLKPVLGHLDFSSCSFTRDDMKRLGSYFNQYLTKLKKLTLHSNPDIGDEGLYFLNQVILGSKIKNLVISDCGVSYLSMDLITSWSSYLDELDLTGNPLLFNATGEKCEQFIAKLRPSTFIKLDDYKKVLTADDVPEFQGVSYRHVSNLPPSPFKENKNSK